eukprot:31247-Pelagococcus_subviridis.AAC.2
MSSSSSSSSPKSCVSLSAAALMSTNRLPSRPLLGALGDPAPPAATSSPRRVDASISSCRAHRSLCFTKFAASKYRFPQLRHVKYSSPSPTAFPWTFALCRASAAAVANRFEHAAQTNGIPASCVATCRASAGADANTRPQVSHS